MYIPFLGDISPESSHEGLSIPQSMIIEHLIAVHVAIETIKRHNVPEPVYMGHNFDNQYAALTNPYQPSADQFSQDLERHLRSTAAQPDTLVRPESLRSSPILRVVSDEPSGHTILDDKVYPIGDARMDRMVADKSDNVRRIYPSGLDAVALGQVASELAIKGDDSRAHVAKAA